MTDEITDDVSAAERLSLALDGYGAAADPDARLSPLLAIGGQVQSALGGWKLDSGSRDRLYAQALALADRTPGSRRLQLNRRNIVMGGAVVTVGAALGIALLANRRHHRNAAPAIAA